jgi:hypothetical protein
MGDLNSLPIKNFLHFTQFYVPHQINVPIEVRQITRQFKMPVSSNFPINVNPHENEITRIQLKVNKINEECREH